MTMRKSLKQVLIGVAALAALALGASALAGATATSTSSSSTTQPTGGGPGGPPGFTAADAPGTAAHENAEKAVTGEAAQKAQAAAVASVGSGTAGAVTTDFRGNGYEVDVTKADSTKVNVHLDSSFKVQAHPGGPRMGGPRGADGSRPPAGGPAPYGQAPPAA
jgi:nicotinic acid phosphoribosyltransferase